MTVEDDVIDDRLLIGAADTTVLDETVSRCDLRKDEGKCRPNDYHRKPSMFILFT